MGWGIIGGRIWRRRPVRLWGIYVGRRCTVGLLPGRSSPVGRRWRRLIALGAWRVTLALLPVTLALLPVTLALLRVTLALLRVTLALLRVALTLAQVALALGRVALALGRVALLRRIALLRGPGRGNTSPHGIGISGHGRRHWWVHGRPGILRMGRQGARNA